MLPFLLVLLSLVFFYWFLLFLLLFFVLPLPLLIRFLRGVLVRKMIGGTRFQLWHVDLAQVYCEACGRGIVIHLSVFVFRIVEFNYLRTLPLRLFVDHVLMQFPFFIHTYTKL